MRRTRSVVSGSVALRIVDRSARFSPRDFDVYVDKYGRLDVVRHFVDVEHYRVLWTTEVDADARSNNYESCRGIKSVTTLLRGSQLIDVIESVDESCTTPIAGFWTTLVMSFIAADAICIPYPTLLEHKLGLLQMTHCSQGAAANVGPPSTLTKYQARGYIFAATWQPAWSARYRIHFAHALCLRELRFFGDPSCATMNIAGDLHLSPTPPFRWNNVWRLGDQMCGPHCLSDGTPLLRLMRSDTIVTDELAGL